MKFTKQQVMWEIRGMTLGQGEGLLSFTPLDLAAKLADLHDENKEFWTVMCAADHAIEKTKEMRK